MPNPFQDSAEELTSGTAECEAVASNQPPLPDATADLSNSAGQVMLSTESAAIEPCQGAVVAVPINVIGHNPITHAVEVRPLLTAEITSSEPGGFNIPCAPGENLLDATDHIGEIFVGARRLPQRELPADFQQRLLAAIESDQVWADEAPLFLQRDR